MPSDADRGREAATTTRVSVVIRSYNCRPYIGEAIESALAQDHPAIEVVVVDDGSTDGTARAAAAAGVRVLRHERNLGYGASLKSGIRRARYDRIAITDADATYPVGRLLDLVEAVGEVDMAIGARTGETVHVPLLRRPAKWCLRKLAQYLTGVAIPDLNSGLRCFRKSTIAEYMHLLPLGFSFTTTVTLAYHSDGRLVRYLPIDYQQRRGSSKIRPLRDTYHFLLLILRTVMYFDPIRIFMPAALVALAATAATFAYELVWQRNLAEKSLILLVITVFLFSSALLGDLIVKRGR